MHKKCGFTLAELLIVVVIVGVLSSLVLPRFLNQKDRFRLVEAMNTMQSLRKGILSYYDDNGVYPGEIGPTDTDLFRKLGVEVPDPNLPTTSWAFGVCGPSAAECAGLTVSGCSKSTEYGAVVARYTPKTPAPRIVLSRDGNWCGNLIFGPTGTFNISQYN